MQDCEDGNGQKLEKGQMVYGGLIQNVGIDTGYKYVYITTFVYTNEGCMECGLPVTEKVEVIPETVGQFTGLTDKNGAKIFEGDILHFDGIVNCLVSFVDGQFVVYNIRPFTALKIKMLDYGECEIIGNIHDNPELLEGIK